jgi:hypothetical protein
MAQSLAGGTSPAEMELFHRGMQLMNNYSEEWQKALPPELVAKNAVKKTVRAVERETKGKKIKKGKSRE